ncbi:MAG: sulfurtransferase [Rhodospirillaceae bacterium]|nr:sulfurtransferase [Rhodospirillaceae bacterium]
MDYVNFDALVSTEWLAEHLDGQDLVVVDASFFVPGGAAPAKAQYDAGHIPGSVFFDINDIADPDATQDHTVPSAAVFSEKVGALGISNTTRVIAYDAMGGGCAAARVWWMFRAYGHDKIAVLDGGLTKWTSENRPVSTEIPEITARLFSADKEALARVRNKEDIRQNIDAEGYQVVDARAAGRFAGTDPEPKADLRSGHIPGSRNVPFASLFEPASKTFKSAADIKAQFDAAGVDLDAPIATTCGSGVTACTVALSAYLLGKDDVAIYDGSWVDWGSDPDTPIETGPVS